MLNNRLPKVRGTKKVLANNQLLISTGLPSLDTIIGGGIPVGSIFLLEEDEFGAFSQIILKHYLAEGVLSDHTLVFASPELEVKKFISKLPAPVTESQTVDTEDDLPMSGELKIAWRYRDQTQESSEPGATLFGHTYDLTKRFDKSVLDKIHLNSWVNSEEKCAYDDLFNFLRDIVQDTKYSFNAPVENRTVLRIALHLLGNMFWTGDFIKFLIKLRVLLRNTCSTCFITVQPNLFEKKHELHRSEHLSDTVIRLQSLLNDGNPLYSDYDGLLFLEKLPAINSWNCYIPESNDWAFKSKKRHFRIEKLHISPDIQENTHRESEDVSKEYETQKIIASVANQF
ncbi:elongator complex protein 4 isoform X2 [Planococcus citri]